ncbi:protein with N-terminal apicomplexan-specific globular domain plus PHD domain [Cryptosporidium ryanae]|uniref:protein with N-terminal apicomplexan-specific globular domain plus PHD domain n=1 Tax=Cryptosporidium ryanae TaxID=515981 RepID=UPI003519FC19|nr:protein with N-terminal apicomplexan-specific globular domain plus PHD domain [Cryptosporidium ryanae]
MEEVKVEQIVQERGLKYASSQILDSHARSLKCEINRRCRDLYSVDKLINYSHIDYKNNRDFNKQFSNDLERGNIPYIYCVSLGCNEGYVDPNIQNDLYFSILDCIHNGTISNNIGVVKITDHSHPVRLATPVNKNCYSLVWSGNDLPESHCIPIVLGEYTGEVKYVGDEDINDESYSFQLTFKNSAFKYQGTVFSSGNSQIIDEIPRNNILNSSISQNTYYPESFEYNEIETSTSPKKTAFFSKLYKKKIDELLSTDGKIKNIGARLMLPNDNEYILSADKAFNEMALLNHYECILNNNFNFRINVQWHSVYIDGWPHIILTTIPGVGIKSGNELAADFGENWFSRIKHISEFNIKKELVYYRSNYNKICIDNSMNIVYNVNQDSFEIGRDSILNIDTGINEMINKYEICEICQNSVDLVIPRFTNHLKSSTKQGIVCPENSYLLCNGCNRAFHYYCIYRPEFTNLASSSIQWFCFKCVSLTIRIIPSLFSKIPFISQEIYISILNSFKNNEYLLPGVFSETEDVIIRSSDEVNRDNSKLLLFRPAEYNSENQRFFQEYQGLEGLSRLKPCYLCYSSFSCSKQLSVGIATICRIHRLHIAPDFDEFFNSVQYTYKPVIKNLIEKNVLKLSLVTEGNGSISYSGINGGKESILKSHINKLSAPRYIIERTRRIICSLRSSLYQSEKHRVELLCKLEKLRRVQDEYFRTISEGNGIIPIFCVRLGDTIVNKEFSGKMYQGIATKYYPKERIFHIEYFDGDREDMEYEEFISLLVSNINSNRINIKDLSITLERETNKNIDRNVTNKLNNESNFHIYENNRCLNKNQRCFNKFIKENNNLFNDLKNVPNTSIFEKVKIIHCSIARQCKIKNNRDNYIYIREIPVYEYVDEPRWEVIAGSMKLKKNIIRYNIYIVLSRLSISTITLTINSKIIIGDVFLNKEIPITLLEDNQEIETNQEFNKMIELSSLEILNWTQDRLIEFTSLEIDVINQNHLECNKSLNNETINEEKLSIKNLKTICNILNADDIFLDENWLEKANIIAQALKPYPNGIKWMNDTHSWKIVYYNEFDQKNTEILKVIPFDEENTVESLYLKACKFLSVSQINNKIIKMLKTNKKQKTEIVDPVHKFVFSEWGNTVEDFLARYNLNNPDRCIYSIDDFKTEINSLGPLPDNVEWSDSLFSFSVKLQNSEKKTFKLEEYDFNIFNCYKSVIDYVTGGLDINEICEKKTRKYDLRIKNSTLLTDNSVNQIKKIGSKKLTLIKKGRKGRKKNLTVRLKSQIQAYNEKKSKFKKNDQNTKLVCEAPNINSSKATNKHSEDDIDENIENRDSNICKSGKNQVEFGNFELAVKKKGEKGLEKVIIRAPPRPNDPLSRARIIEYSKKADELRPFPHGITWCYRSARFKVRYRRPNDKCWTATSFTPTKYNSVKEAFEHAVKKLAAHIGDYKNSNEIPVIPKGIS